MRAAPADPEFGDLLRHWRSVRRFSQLDLASAAGSTPRYVSFVETGRSQPSREMVVRLARALDVPLRERNGLLLAAGFAPLYPVAALGSAQLARVEEALASMLEQHEPYPAVVMDRGWNVLRANRGASQLFGTLLAPDPLPDPANVLRLMIEPGPVRTAVLNWSSVAPALLERAAREAVGGVFDRETAELVRRLRSRPDVSAVLTGPSVTAPPVPVIDVRFALGDLVVELFSVVSTIGTPVDVTAQELRVEAFFPANQATRDTWHRLTAAGG
ncbi:helix-turn-helix domain-containing protein [Kribbella sp. NBC_00889]|uniref:helix-turn-helix domain-containing protein n=1 Tax=Kribbella sp. NBC_00889 TaxID=2975974 RepID=UPI00386C478B|nr:helix-turn-helix transcriptional regulator [Kribbella sp. NBC_00889]